MNKGLPIYNAVIDSENDGIQFVSLVESPAIETNFLAFNKLQKYSLDTDKRIVTGPLIIADFPIYRRDSIRGEYYVIFSKETIKELAEKFLLDKKTTSVNLEHSESVTGVILTELYIKDVSRGISPKEFEDVSDGSLFATYKVENDSVWEEIRSGAFKGFSLEGIFSLDDSDIEIEELYKLFKKIKNVK